MYIQNSTCENDWNLVESQPVSSNEEQPTKNKPGLFCISHNL